MCPTKEPTLHDETKVSQGEAQKDLVFYINSLTKVTSRNVERGVASHFLNVYPHILKLNS